MLSIRNISFSSVFRSHVKIFTENYQSGACTVTRDIFSKREFSSDAGHLEIGGVKLHWERMGHGPHVVLGLPGLAGSFRDNILPVFNQMDPERFTMIGWDPPGYGKSRPPGRKFLDREMDVLRCDAHLVGKLMEELGYNYYSAVGWSYGGRTGALLASFYPDRVQRLVMCSSPKYTNDMSVRGAKMFTDLDNWTVAQRRRMKKTYDLKTLNQMLLDHEQYVINENKSQKDAKIFSRDLRKITVPTLIIYGAKDRVVPPTHALEYNKAIANSRIYKVKEGAHDHLEFLDEFVAATVDFLEAGDEATNEIRTQRQMAAQN